jgi:ABC-type branched-subunit amino acid transport system substrate-binding protein
VLACQDSTQQSADCHWIGSVNPLTGGLGPVGLPLENAAKLAVNDVNAAGGVAGKQLCIATADDRTNPDRAAAVVQALIQKYDIRAINGAAASSATLKAAPVAEANNMTMISCCSTSPEKSGDPLIYRTVPSDALQGVALASLAKTSAAANVAVIYIDNTYGSALEMTFQGAFASDGRMVTKAVPYEEKQSSYVDVVTQALGGTPSPDHVVLIAYPIEGAQIIRDWATAGIGRTVKWLGTDGLEDDNFAITTVQYVPDFMGTAPIPQGRYYEGFATRYMATYGGEMPGIFTSNQYDAVILIALGIAWAGATADPMTIRSAVPAISRPPGVKVNADNLSNLTDAIQRVTNHEDVDYSGVSGEVDIDDHGDVVSGYKVWTLNMSGTQDTTSCYACGTAQAPATGIECVAGPCMASP